jgi:hypothetical protein
MGILWLNGAPPLGLAIADHDGLGAPERAACATGVFEAVWEHYLRSRFLYPAKLERMESALATIRSGWPLLFQTPDDLFQLHLAWETREESENDPAPARQPAWRVVSSIAVFRDTDATFVIQHAASSNRALMPSCIIQCLQRINAMPAFQFNRMYYRKANDWPRHVTEVIERASPPELTGRCEQAYLVAITPFDDAQTPECATLDEPGDPLDFARLRVREMRVEDAENAQQIVLKATRDPVITAALGFTTSELLSDSPAIRADALHLVSLHKRFLASGLRRNRQGFVVEWDRFPVGVAFQYVGATPMNYSYLDTRVEIHMTTDLPPAVRTAAVRRLARTALQTARAHGDPALAALVDEQDREAVARAGFQDSGRSYASFVWRREDASGAPAGPAGIYDLYRQM